MADKKTKPGDLEENEKLITDTDESFRDRVSTIGTKGNRIWVYPRRPKGSFHRARILVTIILLAVMAAIPFVKLNGHPWVLLDIMNRKFILFGYIFWPQDFHIFALVFLGLAVFVVLFTAVYGRIWCGWLCPQTVFMEMVFRKIEYWIEGGANKQKALKKAPWTAGKIFKKGLKHSIFFALSFLIGNLLLAYLIGIDELSSIITDPPARHIGGLTAMTLFALTFYGIFARFREQACIYVCPYGRLQSVLLDKNSIVITYDNVRGEPRETISRDKENETAGDCIDCGLCVQVCPTGIDIRNGTQLECVNCTACIDACNSVMAKIARPKNLIKYASESQISEGTKFRFTPRIAIYTSVLILLFALVSIMMISRTEVETNILRAKGAISQELPNGNIRNLYTLKIVNKTFDFLPIEIKIKDIPGRIELIAIDSLAVKPNGIAEAAFFIEIPIKYARQQKNVIELYIMSGERQIDIVETVFSGPVNY